MSQNSQTHFKNLQQMLQDFESASDHFGALCIKALNINLVHKIKINTTTTACLPRFYKLAILIQLIF